MSGGTACNCEERQVPVMDRNWLVRVYKASYSTFNGRKYTKSKYSEIYCVNCHAIWRTAAKYAELLKHEDP